MLNLWLCILYGLSQAKDQVKPAYLFTLIGGYMIKDRIKVSFLSFVVGLKPGLWFVSQTSADGSFVLNLRRLSAYL